MKASIYFRQQFAAGLYKPGDRPRRSTSPPAKPKRTEAEARAVCAACTHAAAPDGCALINENMLARVRASKGCGGCGGKAAQHYDPKRYYELVLRGAPHPDRMQCRLMDT